MREVIHMMRENRGYGGYGGDGGGYSERSAPVNVGDELNVTIDAVGEKGDGLAKKDGFVLFVPNTKKGDNVRIRVTRVLKKVGFAEVVGQGAAQQSGEASSDEPAAEGSSESPQQEESFEDSENFGEDDENNG
jgi:predicted RNA-binding protein with TRAM domain